MNSINSSRKRMVSVVMVLVLAAAFWFACAGSVHAAATKTFYRPVKIKTTHTESGYKYSSTEKRTYYANGLLKKESYGSDYSAEYKYNEKGYVSEIKSKSEGKVTGLYTVEFKDGIPATAVMMGINDNDEMAEESRIVLTYKNGVLSKEVVTYADGYKETNTYYPNGNRKKTKSNTSTATYNKKGDITKYSYTSTNGKEKNVETYKYTYKKGRVTKIVETDKNTINGKTTTIKRTTTYTYKLDKKGNVTKCTAKVTTKIGKKTYKSTNITTYKYKKFKVEKKYWKFMN
ncbi:MAG: hypothetical protein IIY88_05035 [Eubacterium sp.]|nr:hypothetical protein [Eubacterium sp.]